MRLHGLLHLVALVLLFHIFSLDHIDTAVPNQEDEEEKEGKEIEPWHEWVQRVTHLALKEMRRAQVEDWVDAARDRQFKLAGHISRRNDNRWSTVAAATLTVSNPTNNGVPTLGSSRSHSMNLRLVGFHLNP